MMFLVLTERLTMEPIYTEITVMNESGCNTLTNRYIDGQCTWFRENGSICEVAHYLMGMLHGENVVYQSDGAVKSYDYYYLGNKLNK